MERILSRIEYVANENPTCNILINGKKQCEFTGDSDYFEFPFQVDTKNFTFTIEQQRRYDELVTMRRARVAEMYENDLVYKPGASK